MKTILLHIGHHKTGSSAIQACLAKNVKVLNEVGIDYPYRRSFEWATKGHQSSGNLDASSL